MVSYQNGCGRKQSELALGAVQVAKPIGNGLLGVLDYTLVEFALGIRSFKVGRAQPVS